MPTLAYHETALARMKVIAVLRPRPSFFYLDLLATSFLRFLTFPCGLVMKGEAGMAKHGIHVYQPRIGVA